MAFRGAEGSRVVDRGWVRPRPAFDRRLDGALTHRLTTLVAAAGYGKSTVLASWARAVGGAFYRISSSDRDLTALAGGVLSAMRLRVPAVADEVLSAVGVPLGPAAITDEPTRASALASALSEALTERMSADLVLVLDGLDELGDAQGPCRFVDSLVRSAPAGLRVVIASREALPFPIARLRHDHEVLEFDAKDLALTVDETARWLERRLGADGASLAPVLRSATGGWPAATHAVIDAMAAANPAQWRRLVTEASATSSALDPLARAALGSLPEGARWLLRSATVTPRLGAELSLVLGAPPDALAIVASRGLFLEADADGYQLTPAGRQALRQHAPLDEHEARDVAEIAARWYVEHQAPNRAVQTAIAADHTALVESLLAAHGELLVDHPEDLLAALGQVSGSEDPGRLVDAAHLRLAGLAHFKRGDWDTARNLLTRVAHSAAFDSAVAYRLGVIDHLRGDLDGALSAYQQGIDADAPEPEAIMCVAMAAAARWLRGDRDGCAAMASRARERAARLGDHRPLAAAHTVLAMLAAFDGDGRANDAHYLKALDHAARAGDVAQQIRIRSNRASHRQTEGAFAEALAELEIALKLCDMTGFAPWAALAMSNRAETLIRLGRIEEAAVDASDAVDRWEAMGSRLMSYGLIRQAQVRALRGHIKAAIETFRRAASVAEQSGDAQGLGNALTGLADLVVRHDPETAAQLAERAAECNVGTAVVEAWLAGTNAAIAAGRPAVARELLDRAEVEAGRRYERASLARAAELRAILDGDRARAQEAVERWSRVGDPIGLAHAELIRASLGDPRLAAKTALDIQARMREIGCHILDDDIDSLVSGAVPAHESQVVVHTLGAFRVVRGGSAVPTATWQSRKARDLLKILVSRKGRPVPREQLVELLWPDAGTDPAAAKRLNVMVSTLRSVLDPEHAWSPDHIIASSANALRVDLSHVTVDIIDFLDRVADAAALDDAGRTGEALEHWRAAEAAYTGDFCEEDAYADWAAALRDEARLAYAHVSARIASWEDERGHHEQAARYWLRLLERDPYDERAHLALVRTLDRAGRRGDARRRYRAYADRMRELDIEPSPHPA